MLSIRITYKGAADAKVMARKLRPMVAEALGRVIQWWHAKTLPGHFEESAKAKYKYERRTRKWERRKQREVGHTRPMVYSGALRRWVLRTVTIRKLKTRPSAKGVMRARYFLRKPGHPDPGKPDMGGEVIATIPRERRAMAKLLDRRVARAMRAMTNQRTVVIK